MKCSAAPAPLADEASRRAQEERLLAVWSAGKGFRYWSAVNNTEIGLWYTATTFLFMLFVPSPHVPPSSFLLFHFLPCFLFPISFSRSTSKLSRTWRRRAC